MIERAELSSQFCSLLRKGVETFLVNMAFKLEFHRWLSLHIKKKKNWSKKEIEEYFEARIFLFHCF